MVKKKEKINFKEKKKNRKDGKENKQKRYAIKINFQTVSPELIYSEIAFLTLLRGQPNTSEMCNLFTYEDKTHIVI